MSTLSKHPRAVRLALVSGLLLAAACSGGQETEPPPSPPRMDGNVMYGQSGMDWVLEHVPIFTTRTALVTAPAEAVDYLRDLRKRVRIMLFMGTWCHDSQVHVPVLFKALQRADNDRIELRVIAMDRRKKDLDGLVDRYVVEYSPTIVVEMDGLEIGRVIETPAVDAASDVVHYIKTYLAR